MWWACRELGLSGVRGVGSHSPVESGRLGADVLAHLTRDLLAHSPGADGVFLGARIELQSTAAALEAELGLPVLHGTQASVWWACRELGVKGMRGGGRLFASS